MIKIPDWIGNASNPKTAPAWLEKHRVQTDIPRIVRDTRSDASKIIRGGVGLGLDAVGAVTEGTARAITFPYRTINNITLGTAWAANHILATNVEKAAALPRKLRKQISRDLSL